MDVESARVEHLKLIQALIARMASNSFAIKAASSTLAAALVAVTFTSDFPIPSIAALGGIALIMFGALDAFYISQARSLQKLYDSVRCGMPPEIGSETYFSMAKRDWGGIYQLIVFYPLMLILLAVTASLVRLK